MDNNVHKYGISEENREILNERLGIYADVRSNQPKRGQKVPKRGKKKKSKATLIAAIALMSATLGYSAAVLNIGRTKLSKSVRNTGCIESVVDGYSVSPSSNGIIVWDINGRSQYPTEKFCEDLITAIEAQGFTENEAKLFVENEYGIDTGLTTIDAIHIETEYSLGDGEVKGVSR